MESALVQSSMEHTPGKCLSMKKPHAAHKHQSVFSRRRSLQLSYPLPPVQQHPLHLKSWPFFSCCQSLPFFFADHLNALLLLRGKRLTPVAIRTAQKHSSHASQPTKIIWEITFGKSHENERTAASRRAYKHTSPQPAGPSPHTAGLERQTHEAKGAVLVTAAQQQLQAGQKRPRWVQAHVQPPPLLVNGRVSAPEVQRRCSLGPGRHSSQQRQE